MGTQVTVSSERGVLDSECCCNKLMNLVIQNHRWMTLLYESRHPKLVALGFKSRCCMLCSFRMLSLFPACSHIQSLPTFLGSWPQSPPSKPEQWSLCHAAITLLHLLLSIYLQGFLGVQGSLYTIQNLHSRVKCSALSWFDCVSFKTHLLKLW